MSWLIDELNNENVRLRGENFELSCQRSNLIEQYSKQITDNHELIEANERFRRIIGRYEMSFGLKQDITADICGEIRRLYPGLIDKLKLFWRVICE